MATEHARQLYAAKLAVLYRRTTTDFERGEGHQQLLPSAMETDRLRSGSDDVELLNVKLGLVAADYSPIRSPFGSSTDRTDSRGEL